MKNKFVIARSKIARLIRWFLTVAILSTFILYCAIIVISPRKDVLNRGFIPCTNQSISEMSEDNSIFNVLKSILKSTTCDIKVIAIGANDWSKGKQATPWENYLFEPILKEEEDLKAFYEENRNLEQEMQELKKLSKEIENEK